MNTEEIQQLSQVIFKRKSYRKYKDKPLPQEVIDYISDFNQHFKALNDNISISCQVFTKNQIKTILPWRAPYYIAFFSEEKENCRVNIGFIAQQLDLYLQSKEIGTCWVGLGSLKSDVLIENPEQKFIILMAVGFPDEELFRSINDFKRKKLSEISDYDDEKLKGAQYAPSAINSQPWYFTHNEDGSYNAYRKKQNILKSKLMPDWTYNDIGIALAHIYVENPDTFEFYQVDAPKSIKGYIYEGTFKI